MAGPESSWTTGRLLTVDGGHTLRADRILCRGSGTHNAPALLGPRGWACPAAMAGSDGGLLQDVNAAGLAESDDVGESDSCPVDLAVAGLAA
jgi:hypothetical protein